MKQEYANQNMQTEKKSFWSKKIKTVQANNCKNLEKQRKSGRGRMIFICVSRFFVVCLLVFILCLFPIAKTLYDKDSNLLSEKFFGKKSEFQGVLRLWNIDGFESGCLLKTYFLEKMSEQFEKKNKGVYVMVKNMTEDEVVSSIKAGDYPDMVCFGTGMNPYFNGKFVRLQDEIAVNLLPNFYGSALQNGALMAVPIMTGVYTLISSTERIENAQKNANIKLSSLAFALSTDKQKKKGVVHTNSLTFGTGDFSSALDAFSRKFKEVSVVELADAGVIDANYNSQTFYKAYESFVLNKANMLLGTQRDVFRMENRVLAGKESDAIYEPIAEYTDLVQYVGVIATEKTKNSVCVDFIKFLLEKKSQKQLADIGMFSVLGENIYENLPFSKLEQVVCEQIVVKSTF